MTLFKDMNLSPHMHAALEANQFTTPTPIQSKTIHLAMDGDDIMGSAQTGTGKTLAFVIPLLEHLFHNKRGMGLILAPTRELAQQVDAAVRKLISRDSGLRTALIIGGEPYPKQMSQLRANPRIIVGTPGRIIDHMERGSLSTATVSFLILDETDRMFDMGFGIQLEEIISTLPIERQTLMFSATFPKKIERLAEKYMLEPKRISVENKETFSLKLVQETRQVKEGNKYEALVSELNNRTGSVIVFVKTKGSADKIASSLCKQDFEATAIHGDLRQSKRERVMSAFRRGRYRIMIATDVAARGIDVPHIEHVINYDLPHAPEDFIHRVGRTARAGAEGSAMSFISSEDGKRWRAIQRMLDPNVAESDKDFGWQSDRKPRGGQRRGAPVRGGANNNRPRSEGRSERRSDDARPARSDGRTGNKPGSFFADKQFGDRKPAFADSRGPRKSFGDRDRPQSDRPRRDHNNASPAFDGQDHYTLESFERAEQSNRPKRAAAASGPRDYSKPQGKLPFAKRKSVERKSGGSASAPKPFSGESRFGDKPPMRKKPRAGSDRKAFKAG